MKRALLFLITLVLLYACRKDENPQFQDYTCSTECYIMEGHILEGQTLTPISNANLRYTKYYGPYITDLLADKKSNAEGYYKFEMPVSYFEDSYHSIGLEITKPEYVNSGYFDLISLDSTNIDIPLQKNYLLYRASNLVVRLHNSEDTNFGSVSVGCKFYLEDVSDVGVVFHDSPTFKENLEFKVPSDLPTVLSWSTYGNSIDYKGTTTLIVPRDSTMYFDIYL
jgi:hypothetical protein